MPGPMSHFVGEGGVIALPVTKALHLRHLHKVGPRAVKCPIAAMLDGGFGAGKKPPSLPTGSLVDHLNDKTVVVDCESLTAAVPSVALDLGSKILADTGYLKFSIIIAHSGARVGDRIFSCIANAIDRNIVIGGELYYFLPSGLPELVRRAEVKPCGLSSETAL